MYRYEIWWFKYLKMDPNFCARLFLDDYSVTTDFNGKCLGVCNESPEAAITAAMINEGMRNFSNDDAVLVYDTEKQCWL